MRHTSVWAPGEQAPRPRQAGTGRQTPPGGAMRPQSAAVPPFLTSGLGGTRASESLSPPLLCRQRGCRSRLAGPSPSWLHSCCSDDISNKKSSYRAGGLLYSSSGEPGPTLLHGRAPPPSCGRPASGGAESCCPSAVLSGLWSCG